MVFGGDFLIKKYWKIKDKHDRINAKKQLKRYRKNQKKIKQKNIISYFENEYINNYGFFVRTDLIKLSNINNKIYTINCPEIFSLKQNYEQSMEFISHISSLACKTI